MPIRAYTPGKQLDFTILLNKRPQCFPGLRPDHAHSCEFRAVTAYLLVFATRILVTYLVLSKLEYCVSKAGLNSKWHFWSLSASESWIPHILHKKSNACMTCRVENVLDLFLRCSSSFRRGDSKAPDGSFTVASPKIWNQLLPEVTFTITIEGFKTILKIHLFGGLEDLCHPKDCLTFIHYMYIYKHDV